MPSPKSQRPALRSPTNRMRDQIASVKKHLLFIEQPVVAVEDDAKTFQDIQPESPCATHEPYVCHSTIKLIPMHRDIDNQYEYQFVKPVDVPELSHDGWEVWAPPAAADDTAEESSDDDEGDHDMATEGCTCQPASYRIRYGDVEYLRPENCLSGWGDWGMYRPDHIVEDHVDSQDWHAPSKEPWITTLEDGTGRSGLNLFKVLNEQSRCRLTLRDAVDFYREHVVQDDFEEWEECEFCSGDQAGSGKVLFTV